jgi:multicomponent Na+:H+ antiporter subunit B
MIRPFDSLMLRTLLGPMVAALQLFAVYVLLHGHYSPGGGFQGGILLAASMILPLLTRGRGLGNWTLSLRGAVSLAATGVLIFTVIGMAPLLLGAQMLDYAALPLAALPEARRSMGILLIEVGVMMAVAGAMVAIFYGLAGEIGAREGEA